MTFSMLLQSLSIPMSKYASGPNLPVLGSLKKFEKVRNLFTEDYPVSVLALPGFDVVVYYQGVADEPFGAAECGVDVLSDDF